MVPKFLKKNIFFFSKFVMISQEEQFGWYKRSGKMLVIHSLLRSLVKYVLHSLFLSIKLLSSPYYSPLYTSEDIQAKRREE